MINCEQDVERQRQCFCEGSKKYTTSSYGCPISLLVSTFYIDVSYDPPYNLCLGIFGRSNVFRLVMIENHQFCEYFMMPTIVWTAWLILRVIFDPLHSLNMWFSVETKISNTIAQQSWFKYENFMIIVREWETRFMMHVICGPPHSLSKRLGIER